MGQRGPKPLPANVHLLNGNRSKLSASRLLDSVRPEVSIPEPPDHLLPDAVAEWHRITVELKQLGLVTEIDRAALAVYCQAYARWVESERKLKALGDLGMVESTPSGYRQIGVWLQISNRAVEQMHKFLAEFGMTPSARSRVTPSPQGDLFGNGQQNTGDQPSRYLR